MDEEKVNETILIQGNDADEDPKPQSDSGPDGGSSFGTKYIMINDAVRNYLVSFETFLNYCKLSICWIIYSEKT